MLQERTIHLINAELDGELAAEEQAELEALLKSSAEARAMKAELQRLSKLIDMVPQVSPPPGLSERIIRHLKPPRRATWSLREFFSSFQPAPIGLAFAAGLLLTVAFYEMSPRGDSTADTARMVGTMVAGEPDAANLLNEDIHLRGDGFTGTISMQEASGLYVLNFDLDSQGETWVEVGLDQTGLAFGGFAEIQGDPDRIFDAVAISGGTLRVANQGRQQFAVFLRVTSPDGAVQPGEISIDFSLDSERIGAGASDVQ